MNDEPGSRSSYPKSWIERLGHAFLGEPQSREELFELLKDAEQRNILDADALQMIEGVLDVSQMQVRDIMIPRSQMIIIEIDDTLENMIPKIIESTHSRFPVIGENRDEIMGILLAKDLLAPLFYTNDQTLDLASLLRPTIFVPESKRLDTLLDEFRENHHHMAIVVDEYGGVSGLVTIEDVLEEIVGEIEDEHDVDEDANITKMKDDHYAVKALTPIEEFNEFFKASLNDEEFDTIGGLVMRKLGHLPKQDERVTINGYGFRVLHSDSRRISLLEVSLVEVP